MQKIFPFVLFLIISTFIQGQKIEPLKPLPTKSQLDWAELEFYLFVHFGPNTFTNLEWGHGTEKAEIFNPEKLDCRQWCRIAKECGAKGVIITAKHHDGFCLFPSKFSNHTVAQSKWKDGKGDVLRDLRNACNEYELKMGVYLSPWDRNHPKYGTNEYNKVFVDMMNEVIENYGPLFEFWWDGANGEGPSGKKQVYDFALFERTIREVSPSTIVFSDIGPDVRWVGNESGIAGDPNWNLLDTAGFERGALAPSTDTLNHGNKYGKNWIQGECDVSIRPGWFYHKEENEKVKTSEQLFRLYLKSVGRGANLLLNVPPDDNGLFTMYDSTSLIGLKKLVDENFKTSLLDYNSTVSVSNKADVAMLTDKNLLTYVSLDKRFTQDYIQVKFKKPTSINCIVLQEPIQMGQRVSSFSIEIENADGSILEIKKHTIGRKRIITFPAKTASVIKIKVTDAKATPLVSTVDVFKIDDSLIEQD